MIKVLDSLPLMYSIAPRGDYSSIRDAQEGSITVIQPLKDRELVSYRSTALDIPDSVHDRTTAGDIARTLFGFHGYFIVVSYTKHFKDGDTLDLGFLTLEHGVSLFREEGRYFNVDSDLGIVTVHSSDDCILGTMKVVYKSLA